MADKKPPNTAANLADSGATVEAGSGAALGAPARKTRAEMQALTAKQYIDQTVAPILLQAMQLLVKERPPDPVGFMAAHLLKNRPKVDDLPAGTKHGGGASTSAGV